MNKTDKTFKAVRTDTPKDVTEFVTGYLIPSSMIKDPHYLSKFWVATGHEDEAYPVDESTIEQVYAPRPDVEKMAEEYAESLMPKPKWDTEVFKTVYNAVLYGSTLSAGEQANNEQAHETQAGEQWVSVEERLPEMFAHVLIIGNKGHRAIGSIMANGEWDDFQLWEGENVTHWQPLPAPPIK